MRIASEIIRRRRRSRYVFSFGRMNRKRLLLCFTTMRNLIFCTGNGTHAHVEPLTSSSDAFICSSKDSKMRGRTRAERKKIRMSSTAEKNDGITLFEARSFSGEEQITRNNHTLNTFGLIVNIVTMRNADAHNKRSVPHQSSSSHYGSSKVRMVNDALMCPSIVTVRFSASSSELVLGLFDWVQNAWLARAC